MRILVAYSTKNGSTAEVASAIAARLREQGNVVDLREAREVRSLAGVDALIVGAPIYSGRWLTGGHRLLKRVRKLAAEERPRVAVFALGPRRNEGPEDWAAPRAQFEKALARHPEVAFIATGLFGGADPPKKKARRDVRDWDAIRAWTEEVSALLAA